MFVLMISRSSSNMGYVWSKTRSLGQISVKPCSHSTGNSFASILMKLYQNVCLDDVLVKFEYRFMSDKKLGQICSKPCSPPRGHNFASIFIIYRIWFVALSSRRLRRLFKLDPWGQKWPHTWVQ